MKVGFLAATLSFIKISALLLLRFDRNDTVKHGDMKFMDILMMSELALRQAPFVSVSEDVLITFVSKKTSSEPDYSLILRRLQVYKTKYMKFFGSVGSCAQMGWMNFPERTHQKVHQSIRR